MPVLLPGGLHSDADPTAMLHICDTLGSRNLEPMDFVARGRFLYVSLRNVVISIKSTHATSFNAMGQLDPLGLTLAININNIWYRIWQCCTHTYH